MKRLLEFFRPNKKRTLSTAEQRAAVVAHMLAVTEPGELSCDEVFAVLDEFADRVRAGENPASFMPLVEKHLAMCPDCRDEYEALLRMLEA